MARDSAVILKEIVGNLVFEIATKQAKIEELEEIIAKSSLPNEKPKVEK